MAMVTTGVVLDHLAVRPELQCELPVRAQIEGLEGASLGGQIVVACVPLAAILCRAFVRQLDVRPSLRQHATTLTDRSEQPGERRTVVSSEILRRVGICGLSHEPRGAVHNVRRRQLDTQPERVVVVTC